MNWVHFVGPRGLGTLAGAATSFWWVGIDGSLRRYWSRNP